MTALRAKKTSGIGTREALALASQAADDAVAALELTRAEVEKIPPTTPPDPRDGLGRGLLTVEQSTWARLSPRHRNRWPKLAELDQRVAELDIRQATLVRELETLQQKRSSVEQRHADALATWYTAGQQGQRPASDANELDELIADARGEHDAIDRLRATELAAKVGYVKRNRRSLAKTAATSVAKTKADYETAIAQLEQARDALIDARATQLWSLAYPSESLTATPPTYSLAGGVKAVNQRWLPGLTSDIQAAALLAPGAALAFWGAG